MDQPCLPLCVVWLIVGHSRDSRVFALLILDKQYGGSIFFYGMYGLYLAAMDRQTWYLPLYWY